MKTFHLFALVLFAALLTACGGSSSGISAASPLGTYAAIHEHLTESKGLDHEQRTIQRPECFSDEVFEKLEGLEAHTYLDHSNQGSGVVQRVLVVIDDKKKVLAIGGTFFSGAAAYSTAGTRTESFVARHWKAVTKQEPTFEKKNRPGRYVDEYLIHEWKGRGSSGQWLKQPADGNASMSNTIWDTVLLWRD